MRTTRESELAALMAMASHDLKTPLTSIGAHVGMLRSDYSVALGDDFRRDLAAIERGLGRLRQLADDLLDYARAGHPLTLRPTSVQELVNDLDAAAVTVAGTLPTVTADPTLLRHVLDNLVSNAIKYTPAGTPPRVDIRARTGPGGTTRIEVADRGIGIPPADRPKVFAAFYRCANGRDYPGTGLGLAICRRIIEQHGGTMGVDDNPGGGSCFWFTLPAQPPPR
jgi:signal transduction histidine kinase